MNKVTDELLRLVADFKGEFTGAYNIREDGGCAGRQSTKNIKIESKTDKPGIDIRVAPGTKGEKVYIPACVTHSGVDDLVYNDFYIGEGADVVVVDDDAQPLVLCECKAPEIPIDRHVLAQAVRYNSVLKARYVVLTNGLKHYCCELRDGEYVQLGAFPRFGAR